METKNQKPNSGVSGKPEPLTKLLGTWLRILAETCKMRESEELTPEKIKSYTAVLSDIPLEQLEAGLRRCSRECVWFPTASEIRAFSQNNELEAEQAWEFLDRVLKRHWHPDIGFYKDAPALNPAIEYAIRQCGGIYRIYNADEKQFDFIRKGFLAAHQRYHEEGGAQTHMSQRLAVDTLKRLQEHASQATKQITGAHVAEPLPPKRILRVLTPEETAERIEELKRQAAELLKKQA